jgi:hypothetical protein
MTHEEVKKLVRDGYTGNQQKDLAKFTLGEERSLAEDEWVAEASRRYCREESRRR